MKTHSAPAEAAEAAAKTQFGFWVYLMTDCVLFATLFATYAVLHHNTFGGPSSRELFDLPFVLTETLILLTSSFTAGIATLAAHRGYLRQTLIWFTVTAALGLSFLVLEVGEFAKLAAEGNNWQRSGFLSAFFTLVGTHGLHIATGLLWMFTLIFYAFRRGLAPAVTRRFALLGLFWHFLDVIWIFIFTTVYLMGVL